jgi:hypothetical protein
MARSIARQVQIVLTIFYGQLLAVAVYDLILHGSIDLKYKTTLFYDVGRIVIGAVMVAVSAYSLALIWERKFRLLYTSAVLLTSIFSAYVIINVIFLVFNYSKMQPSVKYPTVIEFVIKAILIAIASFLTFFLAARGHYDIVSTTN